MLLFEVKETALNGLILIAPKIFNDPRGFFMECYKKSDFFNLGIRSEFVQDNQSMSVKGVLRGLHYQCNEYAQAKLVRCIKGAIFDVAVDIRPGSDTFGQWYSVILSEENKCQLYIPEGFAHAYYTLSDQAEIIYKTSREYAPNADRGIIWNDADLNIKWPSETPILSEKDTKHPLLKEIIEF